ARRSRSGHNDAPPLETGRPPRRPDRSARPRRRFPHVVPARRRRPGARPAPAARPAGSTRPRAAACRAGSAGRHRLSGTPRPQPASESCFALELSARRHGFALPPRRAFCHKADMTLPTPESLAELKAALPGAWTQDAAEMAPWLTEWRGRWTGETPLLLQPRTTEEVARAVEICARHGTAIVTQGGGTGLVGGQIPYGEVLLSTRKLRTVRDVTPLDDAMTVEAGVTLLEAQELAKEKDRFFPLSLAAEGSATIGGVISTNAGGTAVLRYGMMRDLVLGIEAVMPDGKVFNGLKRLRKDNTGYDLKQLFIGAEGTLGVVTAATL